MTKKKHKIEFYKKWFNPLYFIIKDLIEVQGIRELYIYGGKSSAKTHTICQYVAIKNIKCERESILFRKQSTVIDTTLKKTLIEALDTVKARKYFIELRREFRASTNKSIILRALDADEKAKGVAGYSYILFDELNHFTFKEWEQALLSFRGEKARAFFGTWNPVSDKSWVKTELVDKDEWAESEKYKLPSNTSFVKVNKAGTRALIKTDYRDNYWAVGSPCGKYGYFDEGLIRNYEALRINNYSSYKVNVLGEWGTADIKNRWIHAFDEGKHTGVCKHESNLPVYLSYDFNVTPYITLTCWQVKRIGNTLQLRCFREYCGEHPHNSIESVTKMFLRDYVENSNDYIEIYYC